ncbi:antA/AntB antirepressor family protein [Escherichia coli]|uniref:antA/AntB antirepressor family protein n=1 Tax=Escherichia coli TaxID=562 RepID=UPI0015EEB007|nr:antA/AntB antirepressor family protein [Escherichia coli]HAY0640376.1 phage antirepressor Ant [Escherichia coli]HEM0053507.1 antA/AntB antirepressor family protein [Escherichia coli]
MTTQLIPVFNGTISNETILLCNARDLHAFLEVGKRFATWITERLSEYEFVKNQDYVIASQIREAKGRGGHNRKDYHLTLDTAKELAMVERNEKGRQIRRYFIECEKKLREDTTSTQSPLNVDIIMRVRNGSVTHIEHHKSGSVITTEWAIHLLRKSGWIVMPRDELLNTPLAQLMPESLPQTGTCVR